MKKIIALLLCVLMVLPVFAGCNKAPAETPAEVTVLGEEYVSIDLSLVQGINHYTGIIFKAYTYGVGDAIVKGGRYDGLLGKFGKEAPSVGCVFLIDELQTALKRQNISVDVEGEENILMVYSDNAYEKALEQANDLRSQGKNVTMMKKNADKTEDYYTSYGEKHEMKETIFVS